MTFFDEVVAAVTKKELIKAYELVLKGIEQNDIKCITFHEMFYTYMVKGYPNIRDKRNYIKENYDSLLIPIPYEEFEKDVWSENSDIQNNFYKNYNDEMLEKNDFDFVDWYLTEHIGIPESTLEYHWSLIISRRNIELKIILARAIQNMSEEELLMVQ